MSDIICFLIGCFLGLIFELFEFLVKKNDQKRIKKTTESSETSEIDK